MKKLEWGARGFLWSTVSMQYVEYEDEEGNRYLFEHEEHPGDIRLIEECAQ